MRIPLAALALVLPILLNSCGGGGYGRMPLSDAPKVVNVSSYDPKEKQRPGDSFSPTDVSALKRNGSHGLIARCGKGLALDEKCADFLASADREGMMLGTYYFMLRGANPERQAEQYVGRLKQISAERGLSGRKVLLVGDVDTKSSPAEVVAFIKRVHALTGVYPVIYLENSDRLRASLRNASHSQKEVMRECPYWIALYSNGSGFETPEDLMKAYGVWDEWAMWQYAGVEWHGRSVAKHYNHEPWRSPEFFGSMDRPLEHNAFNGDEDDLREFWAEHSWQLP